MLRRKLLVPKSGVLSVAYSEEHIVRSSLYDTPVLKY
jgi:hypothetical protein